MTAVTTPMDPLSVLNMTTPSMPARPPEDEDEGAIDASELTAFLLEGLFLGE